MKLSTRSRAFSSGTALIAMLTFGCGGGGGGGGSGRASTINGNVSNASSDTFAALEHRWLARVTEQIIGFARQAFAQGASPLGGIDVRASTVTGSVVSDTTDDAGDFTLRGAPTGTVTVIFSRGRCQEEIILPDVTRNGILTLEDVSFDCSAARPGRVTEIFQGVIRNVPSSPNGNLNVCVASGGGQRTRVVKIKAAALRDSSGGVASFADLAAGQLIEAEGAREGLGASSALDAEEVRILGSGDPDDCSGQAEPTPAFTETPEPTPTETPTSTPTP